MTNNGAKAGPKVWSTLLDTLKKVDEIATDVTENIIAKVKQMKYRIRYYYYYYYE